MALFLPHTHKQLSTALSPLCSLRVCLWFLQAVHSILPLSFLYHSKNQRQVEKEMWWEAESIPTGTFWTTAKYAHTQTQTPLISPNPGGLKGERERASKLNHIISAHPPTSTARNDMRKTRRLRDKKTKDSMWWLAWATLEHTVEVKPYWCYLCVTWWLFHS